MVAKCLVALLALAGAGLADTSTNPLVGTWKLVSYRDTSPGGQPYFPFGVEPRGQFVFTADGHFSAGIQCDENGSVPAVFPVPEFDDLTQPFMGYFGRYAFDPATSTVTWNIDGASAPSYAGSGLATTVSLDGDRLIMKGESIRKNGQHWTWERVLARQ